MSDTLKICLALLVIYLVWGSSYLAIWVGVHSIPPFMFCGLRFLMAAPLMFWFALSRGEKVPSNFKVWIFIVVTTVLMQVLASGFVAWGQQWVPSGEAALIMSSSALWIAWFGSMGRNGSKVGGVAWVVVFIGLLGICLLINTSELSVDSSAAYAAILAAAFFWSLGSMVVRRWGCGSQAIMIAALHLAISGVLMGAISWVFEKPLLSDWSLESTGALFYLVLLNSFLATAAYYWLIHACPPVVLGTFSYVTPAIAVICGGALLGESFSMLQSVGAALIFLSVFFLICLPGRF